MVSLHTKGARLVDLLKEFESHDTANLVSEQVGAAAMSMGKGATVAALGWKQHLIAGGVARGVAVRPMRCILMHTRTHRTGLFTLKKGRSPSRAILLHRN